MFVVLLCLFRLPVCHASRWLLRFALWLPIFYTKVILFALPSTHLSYLLDYAAENSGKHGRSGWKGHDGVVESDVATDAYIGCSQSIDIIFAPSYHFSANFLCTCVHYYYICNVYILTPVHAPPDCHNAVGKCGYIFSDNICVLVISNESYERRSLSEYAQ